MTCGAPIFIGKFCILEWMPDFETGLQTIICNEKTIDMGLPFSLGQDIYSLVLFQLILHMYWEGYACREEHGAQI